MKCLIVDDEPLAREGLARYVAEVEFLSLAGQAHDALEAARFLRDQPVDLLFLDIQMPRLSGLEFLRTLPAGGHPRPQVVLTTAYPDHALEGFQLDVVDYLLKPVTFARFFRAAQKAHVLWNLRRAAPATDATPAAAPPSDGDDSFFIKVDQRYEQIHRREVALVEGRQNYLLLHTDRGNFLTLLTMKSAVVQLPPPAFLRVHKSFMVAVGRVEALEGNTLHVAGQKVPVGRQYRQQVVDELVNRRLWRK